MQHGPHDGAGAFAEGRGVHAMALHASGLSSDRRGAFFSRQPRNATVQAATPCRLWSLTPMRFAELSNRQPGIALEVAMALGALVSRRLANRPRRVAVT